MIVRVQCVDMKSPFIMVIFGATGDLAQNKLFPALLSLFKAGHLGDPSSAKASEGKGKFYIVGFARRQFTDEEYRQMIHDNWRIGANDQELWQSFAKNIYYQQGLFDEVTGYNELIDKLNNFDREVGACITRIFYLATPPDNYLKILSHLHETKLSEGCGPAFTKASAAAKAMADKTEGQQEIDKSQWTRLAIEKPFGKDLENAMQLDKKLAEMFEEKQIYRVDHYLAKETVQNMIAFRFANSIFEPVWNKEHIDHVQITFAEKSGVGNRGKFFDGVGMLRDVAQNHLLQLLATVAMEQPLSFSKESVRDSRANAIKAIRQIPPPQVSDYVVRGQYRGFTEEKNVAKDSTTETFVAMKLFVDTDRFKGVPFYLRAGKKMARDVVDIKIVFIQTCHLLFKEYGCPEVGNVLTIRIQPNEGIGIRVIAKRPGQKVSLDTVDLKFSYSEVFEERSIEAYEKLLLDILSGDQMLFNRSDELESSWRLISGILEGWSSAKPRTGRYGTKQNNNESDLPIYTPGTWGPKEAEKLLEKDGKKWF